jgi:hypothetical protein
MILATLAVAFAWASQGPNVIKIERPRSSVTERDDENRKHLPPQSPSPIRPEDWKHLDESMR